MYTTTSQANKIGTYVGGVASRRAIGRLETCDEWGGTVQDSTSSVRSKTMYPSVKEVIPGDNYVLSVIFDNGENGSLDMKPILDFGIFRRLKDYDAFRRVRVAFDTIEWECGVDLDPEFVYKRCKSNKPA